MNILYGVKDLSRILNIINPAFGAVREEGFDFRHIMPKAYGDGESLLKYHYILCDNNADVATAGNIPGVIALDGGDYAYSFLGSVATLPQYEGKGYMRALMQAIEADDIKDGKVFSLLTGARGRYQRYGYTKLYSGCYFTFDEYFAKHTPKNQDITIRKYNGEIDVLYDIYKATQPLLLRSKEDILPCLCMSRSEIRLIEYKGNVVGYYTFCTRKKNYLPEFSIVDCNLCEGTMREIFDFENVPSFSVYVNPLNTALRAKLDSICEEASISDDLQVRVYNMPLFIKMLVELNIQKGIISADNVCERIVLEGKVYTISVDNGEVSVTCQECNEFGTSQSEFLRSAINNPLSVLRKTSRIFPLAFGINLPDCF